MAGSFEDLTVCVIGPVPPPAGGMANQTAELITRLNEEGVKVLSVAVNPPYSPRWIERARGIRALFRLAPYILNLWRSIGRADVVHLMANSGWSWHLFAVPAIWIAHFRKTPLVLNYRGGYAGEFFARSWRWIRPSITKASAIVVPSPFLRSIFTRYGLKTDVIPNTLDETLFFPVENRPRKNSDTLIAVTRNLEHIYGIDLAIAALPAIRSAVPDARLIIAGSGETRTQLLHQAKTLGISEHVEFTGRLERAQVAELYRNADLLLNPSRVDNSPNSIIEALGCGLPVVSTRAGGIPDLVEHETQAYLVEDQNAEALASAVIKVISDEQLKNHLRQHGAAHSEQFRWPQVREKIFNVYQKAVKSES